MKTIIVFAAVIAMAYANAIGRAGWGAPALPSINLNTEGAAAAAGAGQASAGQALLEQVIGNLDHPAILANINGVDAVVAQGEDVSQALVASKPDGVTSTVNVVDVYNVAEGGDHLDAVLIGGVAAAVDNSAHSDAIGEAAAAAEGSSENNVVRP